MIVKLKSKDPRYPDLSEAQQYFVLGIEADDYRILNDAGKPYLYERELFDVVEPTEPRDWVTEFGEDGERYSYPAPLNEAGFFEDFFDEKPQQTSTFWRVVNQRLAHAA
jgi:hypothetical protein